MGNQKLYQETEDIVADFQPNRTAIYFQSGLIA
jgi:7-keto-8-aminopelargonate synthetase-like enzyme